MLPLVGTFVRLLLAGGEGCGKTLILNRLIVPLFKAFYGSNGVMKEASSNKAVKLILGKTIHTGNK